MPTRFSTPRLLFGSLVLALACAGCRDVSPTKVTVSVKNQVDDSADNAEVIKPAPPQQDNSTAGVATTEKLDTERPKSDVPEQTVEHWPEKEILEVSFDDVKFEIEKGGDFEDSMLTDKIRQLDGRRIRIRGFMLPPPVIQGLSSFVLLQNSNCPFGGPEAYLYHNMMVELTPGETTSFPGLNRPIAVEATFSLRSFPDDGSFPELSIFHLGDATVEGL